VTRVHKVYSSSAVLTASYRFTRNESFNGDLMPSDTLNVIMSLINWAIILIKSGTSRHIFNIEFHTNASVEAALLNADRRTDRRKDISRERKKRRDRQLD